MDPVTHALAGAAIFDALPFRRKLGEAGLIFAMGAAAVPDADLLIPTISRWAPFLGLPATSIHRGVTHAFPIMAVAALILGFLAWKITRGRGAWLQWSLLAILALFSHALLDMVNGGARLWYPFSMASFGWLIVPLVDWPTSLILGLCFLCNQAPRFEHYKWSRPLTMFGGFGRWLDRNLYSRISRTGLARLSLAAVALRLIIGAFVRFLPA